MASLFKTILEFDTLHAAWLQVKKKGSAGGVDGRDIESFDLKAEKYLSDLKRDLEKGAYTPEPYYSVDVSKSPGSSEKRNLGLPTIRDKIAQQAVKTIIEPLFERSFLDVSYAYRASKGAARAIRRIRHLVNHEKRTWVTICDIDKFFDTIDHEILFNKVEEKIWEPEIMELIKLWVKIGNVDRDGKWRDRVKGVAQGGILSPLLSNIYLDSFDKFITEKGYGLVRYSDDFIILNEDESTAKKALNDVLEYLTKSLSLTLNPGYTVRNIERGFTYMGFFFQGENLKIDNQKFKRIKTKIKYICINNIYKPIHEFIKKMNQEIEGVLNYYKPLAPTHQIMAIDEYIKLQISIFMSRKKNSGEVGTKDKALEILKQLKYLQNRSHSESLEYMNEIVAFAWNKRESFNNRSGTENKRAQSKEQESDENEETEEKSASSRQTSPEPESKVERKKKEYYKKRILTGNLIITTPFCFIGKKKERIVIRKGRQIIKEIAVTKIEHLSIKARSVSLSSDVIDLCLSHKIPIDFFNFKGEPTAKIYLPLMPDTTIGIAQLKAFANEKCYSIASSIVESKINNQINLLKYFLKYRRKIDPVFSEETESKIEKMEKNMESVSEIEKTDDMDLYRNRLMAAEGQASARYWEVIKELLKDDVEFIKRERQGARDIVNSCLNYGYSMLYPRIWQAVIQAGLNPMISYLHKEQPGKPTLTFDLIEEFRQQVVDRTVFSMFTKGTEIELTQGELSASSKKVLVENIIERLKTETGFRKQKMTFDEIILHQAKALAEYLLDKKKSYNPFLGKY